MIPTPALSFRHTPVVLILAAFCAAVEVICTLQPGSRAQYYNDFRLGIFWPVWDGELWRPFTTTLLHGNLLHAAFNLWWLVTLGGVIEGWLGSWRTLAIIVLFAYVSTMAQYVFADYFIDDYRQQGGLVGLSGVVYGLFGFLWAARARHAELYAVCNDETVRVLVGWAVVCVALTYSGVMQIANAAHFSGLAMGWLLGMSLFAARNIWQWRVLAIGFGAVTLGTLIYAPGHAGFEVARHLR